MMVDNQRDNSVGNSLYVQPLVQILMHDPQHIAVMKRPAKRELSARKVLMMQLGGLGLSGPNYGKPWPTGYVVHAN